MSGELETPEGHDDLDGIDPPAANRLLVGHAEPLEAFAAAQASGRLHHAWLLQGPSGIGKATAAFAIARRLLRPGDGTMVDEATDRQIASGAHPQLLHLTRPPADRGGFKTQTTVDEIRRLNHFFQTTAAVGWRVAIIDPVDDLNRNAANALLKILEEPPVRAIFLLVNHSPGRLLPTIRSRCRLLPFAPLAPENVAEAMRAVLPTAKDAEIAEAAARSDGSVRTGLAVLLNGGLEIADAVASLMRPLEPDWKAVQTLADSLAQRGKEAAFEFMLNCLFRETAALAEGELAAGQGARAERLAALWLDEQARLREAAAYNLDRKQTVLTFFERYRMARMAFGD